MLVESWLRLGRTYPQRGPLRPLPHQLDPGPRGSLGRDMNPLMSGLVDGLGSTHYAQHTDGGLRWPRPKAALSGTFA